MSRLTDLLRQVRERDEQLGKDLAAEFAVLSERRAFGLNFERHQPEAVELPGRRVRVGDKVRVLPPRGLTERGNRALWRVLSLKRGTASLVPATEPDGEPTTADVVDLVVVAEFRDPIYPGLRSTGRVERGGDRPFHTVINAENYHALQTLLFAYEGKVDCIYIDPPYNTRDKDWKYNNDFVDNDDLYKHSKWLAMMERRLVLARRLLRSDSSALVVMIDDNEVSRLGLLLEQLFPGARTQLIDITISPRGQSKAREFSKVDEYAYVLFFGEAGIDVPGGDGNPTEVRWRYLRRNDIESARGTSKGGPRQFYPIYVDEISGRIASVGEALSPDAALSDAPVLAGCVAVFPIRDDGKHMNWGLTAPALEKALSGGFVRVSRSSSENQPFVFAYLTAPNIAKVASGKLELLGERADGSKVVVHPEGRETRPTTAWAGSQFDAGAYGTSLLRAIVSDRPFPFPKSLYSVEEMLRFLVGAIRDAVILDFFAGSGTTAHAAMRLNRQDAGTRRSISVTNNEVSADEERGLRERGLRPGDPDWEAFGICEYITKPRIAAAVTGRTPGGEPIKGGYKFTDEFPMAEGFEENVEFFDLTYESPRRVAHDRAFSAVAPLLWLRAGAKGPRVESVDGFAVAETYGVIVDLDRAKEFTEAVVASATLTIAFIVTDDDRRFQLVVAGLPRHVEAVRLYESYLTNFEINTGRE